MPTYRVQITNDFSSPYNPQIVRREETLTAKGVHWAVAYDGNGRYSLWREELPEDRKFRNILEDMPGSCTIIREG